jgi:LacI family transcriptional regulator
MAKATLKSISKEIGVSVSTISRVLNNYTDGFSVKPEVRKLILDTVERRSYRPNPILRTMRAKRTMIVAFIHFGSKRFFNGMVDRALFSSLKRLSEEGYQVSVNLLTTAEPGSYLPQFPVDGVIVSDVTDVDKLAPLEALDIPYVSLNGICGPKGVSVQADEPQCARLLFEHLRSLGHSRIAYCHGLESDKAMRHPSVALRLSGYDGLMRGNGLKPTVITHRADDGKGLSMLDGLLSAKSTAAIVYDHYAAVSLLHAAYLKGVPVPESLSVTCFNDEYPAAEVNPALTCVSVPADEMGVKAADLLLRQMREGVEFKGSCEVCGGSLVVRESACHPTK